MAEYESWSEESLSLPDEDDNFDELKPCRQRLGISSKYVRNWTKSNAFREFCQNWTDAMIQTSGVSREKLVYVRKDLTNEFRITVHNPSMTVVLGFLAFNRKRGMLELCNYGSQLSRKVLDMGGTSKDMDDNMAGTHGEGFKLAALLMLRHGHQAKYTASGFYWNLRWGLKDKTTLWCFLSRINRKLSKQEQLARMLPAWQFKVANPWEDVSVKMGNVYGKEAIPINEAEVMQWLKVCLHFDRPKESVHTESGTLILDESFRGKIYLKGLLLEKMSNDKNLRYAYDFSQGHIGRDRKGMEDPEQLGELLANIWEGAVKYNGTKSLDFYIDMIMDQKAWRDVDNIQHHMTEFMARAIWNRLQEKDPQEKKFYHGPQNADKEAAMIRTSLKKVPILLQSRLWKPLTRYKIAQTPPEYRKKIMFNSEIATVLETAYCKSLIRTLRAALALDKRTKSFELVFKRAGTVGLDLYLDLENSQLLLHEKWMDFERSHAESSQDCILAHMRHPGDDTPIEIFSCDHIIIDISNQVLQELEREKASKESPEDQRVNPLPVQVNECLKNMAREIQAGPGPKEAEIFVSWEDNEAGKLFRLHKMELVCCVTLHRESTCSDKRLELIAREFDDDSSLVLDEESDEEAQKANGGAEVESSKSSEDQPKEIPAKDLDHSSGDKMACGCPQKIVTCKSVENKIIFNRLCPTELYFPMVSRAYTPIAFFGLPPAAQKPAGPESSSAGGSVTIADRPKPNVTSKFQTPRNSPNAVHGQPVSKIALGDFQKVKKNLEEKEEKLKAVKLDLQEARNHFSLTQNDILSARLLCEQGAKQIQELQQQIAAASSEIDELKSTKASQSTQLETLLTEKQELTTRLMTMECKNVTLEEKIKELQTQDSQSTQTSINGLNGRIKHMKLEIGQIRHRNEQLHEEIRIANEERKDAIEQKDKMVAERNDVIVKNWEAEKQRDDAVKEVTRLKRQSSGANLGNGAGIKRGRSPSIDLSTRRGNDGGAGGSNSFNMNEEDVDLYGASPPRRRISGLVKSERESLGGSARISKKVRRESSEIIELD